MNLTIGNPLKNGYANTQRAMIVRYFKQDENAKPKHLCMTALDPAQAQTVLYAIQQQRKDRFPYAEQLHKCLCGVIRESGNNKFIWHKYQIASTLRTPSGVIMETRPPLPGRVCEMLVYACINEIEVERMRMIGDLCRFIAGQPVGICAYEFKVQYKVDTQ